MTKKEINSGLEEQPNGYHKLSIQVSLNGLSFCVLDTIANSLVHAHSRVFEKEMSPFALHKIIREDFEEMRIPKSSAYIEIRSLPWFRCLFLTRTI